MGVGESLSCYVGFGCENEMWVYLVDWLVNLFRNKKVKYVVFVLVLKILNYIF